MLVLDLQQPTKRALDRVNGHTPELHRVVKELTETLSRLRVSLTDKMERVFGSVGSKKAANGVDDPFGGRASPLLGDGKLELGAEIFTEHADELLASRVALRKTL
jgi:hypothetical protein